MARLEYLENDSSLRFAWLMIRLFRLSRSAAPTRSRRISILVRYGLSAACVSIPPGPPPHGIGPTLYRWRPPARNPWTNGRHRAPRRPPPRTFVTESNVGGWVPLPRKGQSGGAMWPSPIESEGRWPMRMDEFEPIIRGSRVVGIRLPAADRSDRDPPERWSDLLRMAQLSGGRWLRLAGRKEWVADGLPSPRF